MRYGLSVFCLCLAACGPAIPDEEPAIVTEVVSEATPEEAIPVLEQCDAADYRPLVGTSVAATTFLRSDRLRVFGENDIITQDYLPQRTNVVFDGEGLIARVYCG